MPKNNFELLSKEKQDAILSAAKILFSKHLYDDISMDILVKALALPIATFYRYFKDKEDLFITMLNWRLERLESSEDFIRRPHIDERPALERQLEHTLRNAPEDVLKKLYFGSQEKEITKSVFLKELLKIKYEGDLREEIDPDLIAYMYATTMYNLQMYFREMGMTSYEDAELCKKMTINFYHSFFRYGVLKPDSQIE